MAFSPYLQKIALPLLCNFKPKMESNQRKNFCDESTKNGCGASKSTLIPKYQKRSHINKDCIRQENHGKPQHNNQLPARRTVPPSHFAAIWERKQSVGYKPIHNKNQKLDSYVLCRMLPPKHPEHIPPQLLIMYISNASIVASTVYQLLVVYNMQITSQLLRSIQAQPRLDSTPKWSRNYKIQLPIKIGVPLSRMKRNITNVYVPKAKGQNVGVYVAF